MNLRSKVIEWLGLDRVPSLVMFQAMEKKQAERHAEMMGTVNKLTMVLQNAHAFERPDYTPQVLDWETVQAIALAELNRNPPKES